MTTIYISSATDAVDASLITKRDAVLRFAQTESLELRRIAAIGDSENDLPFMEIKGLGLVGAPNNAQIGVKERIKGLANSALLSREVLEGFLQFYEMAIDRGIEHIVADRDGVLIWKSAQQKDVKKLRNLLLRVDPPKKPSISVLTGSSVDQNLQFISDYRLGDASTCDDWVVDHPEIIWAENGCVYLNVLTGETRTAIPRSVEEAIERLKGPFELEALKRIESDVLPEFGFTYSGSHSEQTEKIYIPPKMTMVTFNIPKSTRTEKDYRRALVSNELRKRIKEVLEEVAAKYGFEVENI